MPLGDTTFSRPAARSFQLYSPSAPRPDQSPSPTIQPFQNPTSEIQARGLYDDDGVRSWVSLATALTQRDSRDDGFTDLGESASQLEVRSLRSHSSVSSRPKAHRDRPRPVQYSDSLFAVLDFQPTAQSDAHSRSDFLQLSHLTGPPSRVHSARHHSSFFARQEATASSTSVPGTRVRKSGRPLQPDGLEDALSLSRELNFRDHTASR
eukprot:m.541830 g.541830  ORF g.541830 m.541830 type:complete len:208 (+) comp57653_c0_seq4:1184-1807(+)